MAKTSVSRRKANPSVPAAPAQPPTLPVQELIDQLFEIGCRVSVCALAAEHLNDDDAPEVEKEAAASLPVSLSEIHRNLLDIVNRLQDLPDARS